MALPKLVAFLAILKIRYNINKYNKDKQTNKEQINNNKNKTDNNKHNINKKILVPEKNRINQIQSKFNDTNKSVKYKYEINKLKKEGLLNIHNIKKYINNKENNNLIYPKKVPKNFIPLYLFETINLDVNKNIIKQNKNELRDTLDLYNKQKNEIIKNEKEIQKTKEDIKKAKEARKLSL